jgi:hypothetical protein
MMEIKLALDPWIVQDGNYSDFTVATTIQFALEFHPRVYVVSEVKQKSFSHVDRNTYRVYGEITFADENIDEEVWILDFGVSAYCQSPDLRGLVKGMYVEAEIDLGIDHYAYMEFLNKRQGIPPIIYDWEINQIEKYTASYLSKKDEYGRALFYPDESKWKSEVVSFTDCWSESREYSLWYLMSCRQKSSPKHYRKL